MSKTFNIRLLSIKDVSIYKSIRLEALKTNPEAFGATYEEEVMYKDHDFRKRLICHKVFGAFVEDRIIGIIGFKTKNFKRIKHNGELVGLYISPDFRDKGAGSSLMQYALEYAKTQVSQLYLHCITENLSLIRFYEKHGFMTTGVYPNGMKLGEKFYDTNIMFRPL